MRFCEIKGVILKSACQEKKKKKSDGGKTFSPGELSAVLNQDPGEVRGSLLQAE